MVKDFSLQGTSMQFNEQFIKEALPNAMLLSAVFPDDVSFSIDSRTIKKGDIFVPLKGKNEDGHKFVKEALEKGADGVFINKGQKEVLESIDKNSFAKKMVLIVEDTLSAFMTLAKSWRAKFSYPVIGITGSVGKTSTKEILSNIVSLQKMANVTSYGNQNTLLGLALNIFKMREDHDLAIFEMGISRRNEMRKLAELILPTHAIITEVGHSHMQGLGSLEDIALEKCGIFDFFKKESVGVINGDQPILSNMSYPHPVVKFGTRMTNRVQARKIRVVNGNTHFILKIFKEKFEVTLPSPHSAYVYNALGAASIAYLLNIPADVIVQGIQKPFSISGRFNKKPLKFIPGSLIDDCYNASPESMKAALLALEKISTSAQKIAVLGDMMELGVNSPFWHRHLGRLLRKVPSLKKVILVGKMVEWTRDTLPLGLEYHVVSGWQDAESLIKDTIEKESLMLVKGSRAMGLDNLVKSLTD